MSGSLSRMVRTVFAHKGNQTDARKCQKDKTGNLQPELMQNAGKVAEGGSKATQDSAVGPAALHLLTGNACSYADFARCRNV